MPFAGQPEPGSSRSSASKPDGQDSRYWPSMLEARQRPVDCIRFWSSLILYMYTVFLYDRLPVGFTLWTPAHARCHGLCGRRIPGHLLAYLASAPASARNRHQSHLRHPASRRSRTTLAETRRFSCHDPREHREASAPGERVAADWRAWIARKSALQGCT